MSADDDNEILGILAKFYLLPAHDPGFAVGRRSNLVFALPTMQAGYCRVNSRGPDPKDYLDFARSDLQQLQGHGAINAVANAKRAIHLAIDAFARIYCLESVAQRQPFPVKLDLLEELGAFPTRLVQSLNRKRNLIEHEYQSVSPEEAVDLVEVAELFVTLAYRFFRQSTIGAAVGEKGGERCVEWLLNPERREIQVLRVEAPEFVDSSHGPVVYNLKPYHPRLLLHTVPLISEKRENWLRFLDLFVYFTRARAFDLGDVGRPGTIVPTRTSFECTGERDELGRRKYVTTLETFAPESAIRDSV